MSAMQILRGLPLVRSWLDRRSAGRVAEVVAQDETSPAVIPEVELAEKPVNLPRTKRARQVASKQQCEILTEEGWLKVDVERAIEERALHRKLQVRCSACHGAVKLHKRSKTGAQAHFEHMDRASECVTRKSRGPKSREFKDHG